MRNTFIAVAAIVLMVLTVVPLTVDDDSDAFWPEGEFKLCGYVKEGNVPFSDKNALVSVYTPGQLVAEKVGISEGRFEILVPATGSMTYYLSIQCNSYTISGVSTKYMNSIPLLNTSMYGINDFRKGVGTDTGTWWITDELNTAGCISMSKASGDIIGKINDGSYFLSGAKIEILNGDSVIGYAVTNNGNYIIKNCPIGNYKMSITKSGYKTVTSDVFVKEGTNTFDRSLEKDTENTFMGLDFPHFIMVIGGIIGIAVVVTAIVYRYRLSKGDDAVFDDDEGGKP